MSYSHLREDVCFEVTLGGYVQDPWHRQRNLGTIERNEDKVSLYQLRGIAARCSTDKKYDTLNTNAFGWLLVHGG
jgi:hypothetical protein